MTEMRLTPLQYMERVAAHFGTAPHAVFVSTFGCQQNEADSERLYGMAHAMGYADAATEEEADLILINTCAIREHAELKVLSYLGTLKALKEKKPALLVGVCGCMPAQGHRVEQLKKSYPYVSFTLDPASLDKLPEVICTLLEGGRRRFVTGEETPPIAEGLPCARSVRHKAWVSIMYGCNNFCSYCIVPYVRGRERSRASGDILREVETLVADGCHDITLLGQNVNSYRGDCDFAALMEKIACLPGDFRLRFMTSHPKDVSDRLISVMAEHGDKIAPHFHLPLQSGSNEILARMNRRYTRERYLETVGKLRAAMPQIALSTDIIVGFPGETEEDFNATMQVIEHVEFDMIYSFLYSPRKGTPAATMEEQVDAAARAARMERLLAVQNDIALRLATPYVDRTVRVLADARGKQEGILAGRTDTNRLVYFAAPEEMIGQFAYVKITRAEPFALRGELINPK